MLFEAFEERIRSIHRLQIRTAILAGVCLLHLAAQRVGDKLRTVADTQHGHLADKLRQIDLKRLGIVNRVGRTTQDHADHRRIVVREFVVRHNLAEGVQFTNTTTDQLRRL